MAILEQHGKEITVKFETLDIEKGVAIVNGETEKRQILIDEFEGLYVPYHHGTKLHIVENDIFEHGYRDEEAEEEGFYTSYEICVAKIEKLLK